uniref:ORFan n=1 Tax=Parastrongyloides trichosuri TaxID=131310 RepID=A0A0N4ZNQ8_PARTI
MEKVTIINNPNEMASIAQKIVPIIGNIVKSHVFISFNDDKSMILNDDSSKSDHLLPFFLKGALDYSKMIRNQSKLYIDARGGLIYNNVLYDLKLSVNPKNNLVASVGKNFDRWITPYAPNFFNISINNKSDLDNCLQVFQASIKDILKLLPKTRNECPKVYIVDLIELDIHNKRRCIGGRYIFIDIPCCKNGPKGIEVLNWFQSEHIKNINKCKDKIQHDPLYASMKGFLLKDTSTTFCFKHKNPLLRVEFTKVSAFLQCCEINGKSADVISTKKFNEAWYFALADHKDIISLAKLVTYVPAATGKEDKKKKKESEIKKIENSIKDIIEKLNDSMITGDCPLRNYKCCDKKRGHDHTIIEILEQVKGALNHMSNNYIRNLNTGEMNPFIITGDSDSDDSYTTDSEDMYEDSDECDSDGDFESFARSLEQWDEDHKEIIDGFSKYVSKDPLPTMEEVISTKCPNLRDEYNYIKELFKDNVVNFDCDKFNSIINNK